MKISKQDVIHVANLARLELSEDQIHIFSDQIGTILDYMDSLNQVDTTNVVPTTHAIFLTNAFREDIETGHMDREDVLSNAPHKDDVNFLVPRIIG